MIISGEDFKAALAQVTTDALDGSQFKSYGPIIGKSGWYEFAKGQEPRLVSDVIHPYDPDLTAKITETGREKLNEMLENPELAKLLDGMDSDNVHPETQVSPVVPEGWDIQTEEDAKLVAAFLNFRAQEMSLAVAALGKFVDERPQLPARTPDFTPDLVRYVVSWEWLYGPEHMHFDTLAQAIAYREKVKDKYPNLTTNVTFYLTKEEVKVEKLEFPE